MKDPLLGKTCKTGLHCLANDFLTGWGEWWDLQEVQPWDDINTYQLAVYIQLKLGSHFFFSHQHWCNYNLLYCRIITTKLSNITSGLYEKGHSDRQRSKIIFRKIRGKIWEKNQKFLNDLNSKFRKFKRNLENPHIYICDPHKYGASWPIILPYIMQSIPRCEELGISWSKGRTQRQRGFIWPAGVGEDAPPPMLMNNWSEVNLKMSVTRPGKINKHHVRSTRN